MRQIKAYVFIIFIFLEPIIVSRNLGDPKMLGSSRRQLQREVEDDEAVKERKEMMTIQRVNLKTALVSSTS